MTKVQGRLIVQKKSLRVAWQGRKGEVTAAIPDKAVYFDRRQAVDGRQVEVELNEASNVVKVTIPGEPEVPPMIGLAGGQGGRGGARDGRSHSGRGNAGAPQPRAHAKTSQSPPSILGMPFHNPYTFLPFPERAPTRRTPTLLSVDERSSDSIEDRYTGLLDLEITTLSPLLTCEPGDMQNRDPQQGQARSFRALTIGRDVVVPATGVRGALRTLLTILTGGTLGYVNRHQHLCQQRDVNLGPRGKNGPTTTPVKPLLAEVVDPGTALRPGRIRLGRTIMVAVDELRQMYRGDLEKIRADVSKGKRKLWVRLKEDGDQATVVSISDEASKDHPWRVKLSGRRVNKKGRQREGAFCADGLEIEIPAELWADYSGRNTFGDRPELRAGDLVWLEPSNPELEKIRSADQIVSLQWARWGRKGVRMLDKIPAHVHPDYLQSDGRVDEVTDLFGQVSPDRDSDAPARAGRIRPENLVFRDSVGKLMKRVPLAPLSAPHPGCLAFYRQQTDPNRVSSADSLRGYKVYRTTKERGESPPWTYQVQGVYDDKGQLKSAEQQNMNKVCDLVPEGSVGRLRIAFRGLTRRELGLLLLAADVPWRLGGGKPLGLGSCRVRLLDLLDEDGERMAVKGWTVRPDADGIAIEGWQSAVAELAPRVELWRASQVPVDLVRYPRAVDNRNAKARGGHVWFQRHAKPVLGDKNGASKPGLETMAIDGELREQAKRAGHPIDPQQTLVAGQSLPQFDPKNLDADLLYGYDGIPTYSPASDLKNVVSKLEPFGELHVTGDERSEGNQGKNAQSRRDEKRGR